MPNWSFNTMHVASQNESEAKELKRLRDYIKTVDKDEKGNEFDVPISFQKIIPMPDELKDTVSPTQDPDSKRAKALRAKYGFDNWYDWRWKHWGTKWDACDVAVGLDNPDEVYIEFSTAWAFPTPIAIELSKQFPTLTIAFDANEEGGAYDFTVNFKNGKVVYYAEWVEAKYGRVEVPKPVEIFYRKHC